MPGPTPIIKVTVHYIAAGKPYKAEVASSETVGTLKANVLAFFKLVEEGNKTFKLFMGKTELPNMSETIGQVSGDKTELNLELEEFITQGK